MKIIYTVLITLGVLFFLRWIGIGEIFSYYSNRVCVKSHEEQYMQAPVTVNVGGGNYGGGIGVPIGVIKIKTRIICDDYQLPVNN